MHSNSWPNSPPSQGGNPGFESQMHYNLILPDSVAVSTTDSDSVSEGSNPSRATTSLEKIERHCRGQWLVPRHPKSHGIKRGDFESLRRIIRFFENQS